MNPSPNESLERFKALIDVDAICKLKLLIVGLGRVGMSVTRKLIEWPIGHIRAVDFDHVSAKEEGSVFPLGMRGKPKVLAAHEVVHFWNSDIEFQGIVMQLNKESFPRFLPFVDSSDILLFLADSFDVLIEVTKNYHHRIPIVAAGISEKGSYAEISWSVPRLTRCVSCTLNASEKKSASGAANLPLDVDGVANVIVATTMGIALAGKRGFELFQSFLEPRHNLLIVHNRNNNFTTTSNNLVPRIVRLVESDGSCSVCR